MLRLALGLGIVALLAGAVYYAGEEMGGSQTAAPPPPPTGATGDPEDDGSKKAAKQQIAKKRWISRANALCRRAERESSRLKWPTTADKAEPVIETLGDINTRYRSAFSALRPAKQDRRKFARVLAVFEKDARLIDEYLAAVRSQQAPRSFLDVLFRLGANADKKSALLYELGARRCATGFSAPYPS